MSIGSFKAALLGAAGSGGETFWAGFYYVYQSSQEGSRYTSGDIDSEGNIVVLVNNWYNNGPTGVTIDGGPTPAVLADTGGYYSGLNNMFQNATVRVRDDGKIAAAFASYGKCYYHLHTSVTDWSFVSGFDPYYYSGAIGTDNPPSASKGRCMDSHSNADYTGWTSYYAGGAQFRPEAAKQRDSGTSGNVPYRWSGSRTGNDEAAYTISFNSASSKLWLCCSEETGSSVFPIQFLGFDSTTASPGSGGTTRAALTASGVGYRDMHYNARSGYDTAGYLAATISQPNTKYGLMVAKATSADSPASLAWSRRVQIGSPAYTYSDAPGPCSDPVVDSAGNIYVAYFTKLLNPNQNCYVIHSWQNDGTYRWGRTLRMEGTSGYQWAGPSAADLMVTADDNLVFVGVGGMTSSSNNHPAVLVARLPSDGSLTSSTPVQPRGDTTCEIYWENDLTGNWAPSESAGLLTSTTDTNEAMNSGTATTTNVVETVGTNTRNFGQAEVTG